jgi:uncharacterized membrane protein YccC
MASLTDELQQIADDAARTRRRLEELARACAELRAQLGRHEPTTSSGSGTNEESPRKLQSVS